MRTGTFPCSTSLYSCEAAPDEENLRVSFLVHDFSLAGNESLAGLAHPLSNQRRPMEIQKELDPEASFIKIRDLGMERVDRLKYPQVSVVMPVRNEERFIDQCLRSVFSLDAEGMEVLVVDGMSTDGTRQILNGWAKRQPNLRVLDNPKQIVPAAMNIGIKAAKGKWIIRMDAHTVYAPNYIQQCLAAAKETGADNVGGPWVATGNGLVGRAVAAAFHSRFGNGGARGHDPDYSGPVDTVYLGCWPGRRLTASACSTRS